MLDTMFPATITSEGAYANLDQGMAAAREAREQQGLDAALHILALVREQFPQSVVPTYQANAILRAAGRLDEADAWLSEARSRVPLDAGLAAEHARSAHRRRDFVEAVRRWRILQDQFPGTAAGYAGLAASLRASGQLEAAESAAAAGLECFPEEPGLQAEHAFVAHTRRDWAVAASRWERVRARLPEQSIGYLLGAQSMREIGQFDAAETLLLAATERFPDLYGPLVEFAWVAHSRRNWTAAIDRWQAVRARFPDQLVGYTGAARALRELRQLDEADALLGAAVAGLSDQSGALIEYASLAHHRRDWQEATRRWARLRALRPDEPTGYRSGAAALREAGQLEAAEALLTEAMARFPGDAAMLAEFASTAHARTRLDDGSAPLGAGARDRTRQSGGLYGCGPCAAPGWPP